MWVLTEDAELVNLDHASLVNVRTLTKRLYPKTEDECSYGVTSYEPGEESGYFELCACTDEAHGKAIVRRLWQEMIEATDRRLACIDIGNVKLAVEEEGY